MVVLVVVVLVMVLVVVVVPLAGLGDQRGEGLLRVLLPGLPGLQVERRRPLLGGPLPHFAPVAGDVNVTHT